MKTLRVGTRGSDLALWQTRWVAQQLCAAWPDLHVEEVIIKTHGDLATQQKIDADWPVGGFVGAIEQALAAGDIDFAVHSYKDLPTVNTPGLSIAAVPVREVVHDVLITREPFELASLPAGFRLGTGSPRRAAQFRRVADVQVVPIRGNVPTRIEKLSRGNLDGVALAAAGLKRLNLDPPNRIDLPTDRFVPSPAQGALAVQTRDAAEAEELLAVMNDKPTRRRVEAERSFLRAVAAGCHVPIAALASLENACVILHGQLFSDDGARLIEGIDSGDKPMEVGARLARRLLREFGRDTQPGGLHGNLT